MDEALRAELERLRDEDKRQNQRIDALEALVKEIQSLTLSIQGLAKDMEQMLIQQQTQGKRLDTLEREPANAWRDAKKTLAAAVISTVAGGLATGLIVILSQSL